jgi:TonB family protein
MILSLIGNGLWQGALVVGFTVLALRLVPARNATTRYAAWFAALVAMVAMPLLTATVHWHWHVFASPLQAVSPGRHAFSLIALAPATRAGADLARVFGVLWLAGAALAFTRLAVSFARIARIRRGATPASHADGIPVLVSSELSIPIATGIASPAIVLPRQLAETLEPTELQCTIEHELAHLRRGDVVTNAIERIVEAALFWNPWVHLAGRRLAAEREAACDDWAVRRLGEPNAYASCLAELGRRMTKPAAPLLTPSAFGSRHSLVTRIERLMTERSPSESKLNYVAVGGITMLFVAMTVLFQTIVPAPAHATALSSSTSGSVIAQACKSPNSDALATKPAAPTLPKSQWPSYKTSAIVEVTITPNGKPVDARIYKSSGNANVDRAVVAAAQKTTYSPKRVNCTPVTGSYLFRADFAP